MRVFGLGLVALAALSAYGLVLHDQLSHDVAVVASPDDGPIAALRSPDAPSSSMAASTTIVTASVAASETRPGAATAAPASAAEPAEPAPVMAPVIRRTNEAVEPPLFVPPIVSPNPALPDLVLANEPVAAAPSTGTAAPVAASAPPTPPAVVMPAVTPQPPSVIPPSSPPHPVPAAAAVTAPVALTALPASAPASAPAAVPPAPVPPTGDPRIAKVAFGAMTTAAPMAARAIGFYSRGCLAGARMLPVDGPAWQAMRLSRNRNWGHPVLVRYVEKLAMDARAQDGWPGLLVGDLSQPRGGPMLTGHASHQIGLDADIWFTPMPDRRLTTKEREDIAATDMLGPTKLAVDAKVWKPEHVALIKRAASFPEVERVLVHPAIKKALCDGTGPATGAATTAPDREWLKKVRPYWGHHYHFHVRVACPPDSTTCAGQAPPPNDDGCGKELDDWFKLLSVPPKPEPVTPVPAPPQRQILVDQLPAECRQVLETAEPSGAVHAASALAPLAPLALPRRIRSPAAAKATAKAVARVKAKAAQAQRSAGR